MELNGCITSKAFTILISTAITLIVINQDRDNFCSIITLELHLTIAMFKMKYRYIK